MIFLHFTDLHFFLTCRVGEVDNFVGRLQQVGAAGRQVAGDGHDGHAVTTLLGANDAVVLRVTHAAVTGEECRGDEGKGRAGGKGGERKDGIERKRTENIN